MELPELPELPGVLLLLLPDWANAVAPPNKRTSADARSVRRAGKEFRVECVECFIASALYLATGTTPSEERRFSSPARFLRKPCVDGLARRAFRKQFRGVIRLPRDGFFPPALRGNFSPRAIPARLHRSRTRHFLECASSLQQRYSE